MPENEENKVELKFCQYVMTGQALYQLELPAFIANLVDIIAMMLPRCFEDEEDMRELVRDIWFRFHTIMEERKEWEQENTED